MNKYIKYLTVMLLMSSLLFSVVSCGEKKRYVPSEQVNQTEQAEVVFHATYIIGTSNGADEIAAQAEYPWGSTSFQAESPQETITVNVLGHNYTGTYEYSWVEKLNSFTTDYYRCEDGTYFGVKAGTNELISIDLMTNSFFDTEPMLEDVEDPKNYAIEYGRSIASQYVNLEHYRLLAVTSSPYTTRQDFVKYDMTFYYVTFAKMVNGFYTSDYITMKITSKGHLGALTLGDIGAFDNMAMPATFTTETIDASIFTALNQATRSIETTYSNHSVGTQRLTKLPTGETVVYSWVTVEGYTAENKQFKQGVAIITTQD